MPPSGVKEGSICMQENNVKPEMEVFDVGHIHQAIDLIKRGLIAPLHFFNSVWE